MEKDINLADLKLQVEEVSDAKCISNNILLLCPQLQIPPFYNFKDIHFTDLEKMCKSEDPTLVPFYQAQYAQFFDELRKRFSK